MSPGARKAITMYTPKPRKQHMLTRCWFASIKPALRQRRVSIGNQHRTQQTQNICITFIQRRPNVFDVGPTL